MNFFGKHPAAALLVVAALCYLAFFHALGNYPLWDPDEGRSGLIAKEMLDSGTWSSPTLHGKPYYDKPAPYFWLLAAGLKTLGFNELALRLPSAVAASLTVILVYLWASLFWGWRRGLWAGLVLVGSVEFVVLGRFAKMDMVFSFFFTAALLFFWWWKEHTKRTGWIWPLYLFLALAALAKGPVGLLLPLLIVVLTLVVAGCDFCRSCRHREGSSQRKVDTFSDRLLLPLVVSVVLREQGTRAFRDRGRAELRRDGQRG